MTYVISDIHGEYELFLSLMDKIGFSDSDTLYVLGDIIEKGPQSVALARWLFSRSNVFCIRGNHEEAFLDYYHHLTEKLRDSDRILRSLQEYIAGDGYLLDWDTVDRLDALPYYVEEERFICVHAGLPMTATGEVVPPRDAPKQVLLYDRRFKRPDVIPLGSRCVFFGHTQTLGISDEAKILVYERAGEDKSFCASDLAIHGIAKVHMDLGTSISGTLGVFCVESCLAYYVKRG